MEIVVLPVVALGLLASVIAPWVLILRHGTLPWSVLVWLLAVIVGSLLVLLSGAFWLSVFMADSFSGRENYGAPILMMVSAVVLLLSGVLASSWSVAWGYYLAPSPGSAWWFQGVGLVGTAILGGLLPWAMAVLPTIIIRLIGTALLLPFGGPNGFGGGFVAEIAGGLHFVAQVPIAFVAVNLGSCLSAYIAHSVTLLVMRRLL